MNTTDGDSNANDRNISYHESQNGGIIARIVRRMTRWAWKAHVHAPINRMHERGLINSRVYHEAHDYATRIIHETKPQQKSTWSDPVFAVTTVLLIVTFALNFTACETTTNADGSKTKKIDQVAVSNGVAIAEQIAGIAIQSFAASKGIPITSPAAQTGASAQLAGIASLAQANLGAMPATKTIAQGADNASVGSAIKGVLPTVPINQTMVNNLFAAAATAAK